MKQVKIGKNGPKYICLGKLASSGGPSSIIDLLGFAVFEISFHLMVWPADMSAEKRRTTLMPLSCLVDYVLYESHLNATIHCFLWKSCSDTFFICATF
jgi:hypothetical protein